MHIACGDQVEMQRRSFLKTGVTAGGLAALGVSTKPLLAHIPPHNFDRYDFGSGPAVSERLYQGPFSADDYPSWNVVMALTPSREIVANYGMGLITYVCDEVGPAKKEGETLAESIEKLVKIPLGTKLYIRVNWKDVQREPGKLDPCEHWKLTFDLARRYQKRVGFRVMMSNPDIPVSPLPEFLRDKVPMVKVVDRTIRSLNWLRTDTIFIENEQIEALSNRPPWTGVSVEVGISDGSPQSLRLDDGVTYSDNVIHHVQDVGPCYFSLWNWHRIQADRLLNYYHQFPDALDELARRIGYRVRPSWVWSYEEGGSPGLIIGFVNDGLAAVPGVLRISVHSEDRKVNVSGCLDAGYPLPGKVRQAKFALPKGTKWKGLRLKAEIVVKEQRYPVRWACHQNLNEDGSLTLRTTNGLGQND